MADVTHSTPMNASAETMRPLSADLGLAAAVQSISRTLRDVVALTKPRITLMALIVAGGAMLLAPGTLALSDALLTLLGVAMAVGGAGALNMVIERDVDVLMERTRDRPIAGRRLAPGLGVLVGGGLAVGSLPLLFTVGGALTCALTAFSLFVYVLVYTPMKRTSPWSLLVGAVPGAMPALMGSTAVSDTFDTVGVALFAFVLLWQIPHFLAIAIYREHEYVAAGHRVLPALRGMATSKWCMLGSAAALAFSGVALTPLGVASHPVGALALVLGIGFVWLCMRGFGLRRRRDEDAWARTVFRASLVYQTLLFAALAADRLLDAELLTVVSRAVGGAA